MIGVKSIGLLFRMLIFIGRYLTELGSIVERISGNMTTDNKGEKKKLTIQEFIESNDKLLTAFSIFIALTLFSKEMKIAVFSEVLSFLFLTISILIWFELWTSSNSKDKSLTFFIFENLLNFVTIGLIGYWIFAYKNTWKLFALIFIVGTIAFILGMLDSKYEITNRFFNIKFFRNVIIKRLVLLLFVPLIVLIIVFVSSIIVYGGISPIIDFIDKGIMK